MHAFVNGQGTANAVNGFVTNIDGPVKRAVYGPGLDGEPSDKADLLAHLIERESIDPATAAMVGDR